MSFRKSSYSADNGACVEVDWVKSSFCVPGDCVEIGVWNKSSYSGGNGNCVEVGAWNKSSYSGGECLQVSGDWLKSEASADSASCVEVNRPEELAILVRDSKDPSGPVLKFNKAEWEAFLLGAKDGEFDIKD